MLLTRSFVGLVAAALAARALPVTGRFFPSFYPQVFTITFGPPGQQRMQPLFVKLPRWLTTMAKKKNTKTGQQEYSLLLRGRMGSTASPASDKAAYALEVDAADGASVLGQ